MDVFEITNHKSAIIFDVRSIYYEQGHISNFIKYLYAFENFMAHVPVSQAIISIPPNFPEKAPNGINNSKFIFSEDSIENHMIEITKDPSISLIVCFGKLQELLPLCNQLEFPNAIIITEDDITYLRDLRIIHQFRILPARILYYLGSFFWWRVMPKEFIPIKWIQYPQMADKSLNEMELLAQVTLRMGENPQSYITRNRIFRLLNYLYEGQISSEMAQISGYLNDLKKQNPSNEQKKELFNIIAALIGDIDTQFLKYSVDEMNSPRIRELLMQFQKLVLSAKVSYFHEKQVKIIDQICNENRNKKGRLSRRFDYTQYNFNCPIITRK